MPDPHSMEKAAIQLLPGGLISPYA